MTKRRYLFLLVLTLLPAILLSAQQVVNGVASVPPSPTTEMQPVVSQETLSRKVVRDVHLRPLFSTAIRLPDSISSVDVGAPTLFNTEHTDRVVYVKPATKQPAVSNLSVTLRSGEIISWRLISPGVVGSSGIVDFLVDYSPQQSLFLGSTANLDSGAIRSEGLTTIDPLDQALRRQAQVGAPQWQSGTSIERKSKKVPASPIAGAIGQVGEERGSMLVAYSVMNQSDRWLEVLPPQIELSSPDVAPKSKAKKSKKHEVLADQVPVHDYRVNGRKLAPGARLDGVVAFSRPGFKQSKENLLLQLAASNSVDQPLLLAVPFVAPHN